MFFEREKEAELCKNAMHLLSNYLVIRLVLHCILMKIAVYFAPNGSA